MYNRYISQQDGSFQRSRMQDQPQPGRRPPQAVTPSPQQSAPSPQQPPAGANMGSFLKGLLPGNFDTGDLLIVLLVLLMAGDREQDRNHALLTLAIYLFL